VEKTDEREVKFAIEPEAAKLDLRGLPAGLRTVERAEIRLRARYFDTADLDLLRRGITLRHRRDLSGDGEEQWTLKLPTGLNGSGLTGPASPGTGSGGTGSPGTGSSGTASSGSGSSGGVLRRTELSWPGGDDAIPDEARRALRAVHHEHELRQVADFVTVRRRHEIHDRTGRRLAEIDDDRVTVTAPTGRVFRQIEVELDGGDRKLIARLTKLLLRSGASRSDNPPKLRLALAERADAATPAHPPRVAPSTLGDLFGARLAESLDKLVTHDIGLRLEQQSFDVHQARVACRRLRSDLKTFAPILQPDWATATSAELRWLGDTLGAVRDLDVLGRRIAARSDGPDDPDADGYAAVAVRIAALRAAAWDGLRSALDGDRYQQLLVTLEATRVHPPLVDTDPVRPDRPAPGDGPAESMGRLVGVPWRRLRRTVKALPARPSDAQLHRVRIRAKQLRYAAESAAPVLGAPASRLAKAAERLQTELGDQHDAVVAEGALRRLVGGLDRHAAFVAGLCGAAERVDARAQRAAWPDAWRALDDKRLRRWLQP
jgi:CHAD domain-containing protein